MQPYRVCTQTHITNHQLLYPVGKEAAEVNLQVGINFLYKHKWKVVSTTQTIIVSVSGLYTAGIQSSHPKYAEIVSKASV